MQGLWACLGFRRLFPPLVMMSVSSLGTNQFLFGGMYGSLIVSASLAIVTICSLSIFLFKEKCWGVQGGFLLFFFLGSYEALGVFMLDFRRDERSISTGRSFFCRRRGGKGEKPEREGLELNRMYLASHSALSYINHSYIPLTRFLSLSVSPLSALDI